MAIMREIVLAMMDSNEAYKLENDALRNILQRRGLSDATIARRVHAYKKLREGEESASQLWKRVCEEILKRIPEVDLEEMLAEMPTKGKPQ